MHAANEQTIETATQPPRRMSGRDVEAFPCIVFKRMHSGFPPMNPAMLADRSDLDEPEGGAA